MDIICKALLLGNTDELLEVDIVREIDMFSLNERKVSVSYFLIMLQAYINKLTKLLRVIISFVVSNSIRGASKIVLTQVVLP